MNDFSANIIIGVIAGLLATLLTVGFRQVWISIIVPWFEELVYKDAKIEGTWYGLYEAFEGRYDVVNLKRNGHHVEAAVICSSGMDCGECYNVTGSFRNLILSATYETENRRGLDRGALTLMLVENGTIMKGVLTGYMDEGHKINYTAAVWYRNKTEFDKHFKKIQKTIEENKKS